MARPPGSAGHDHRLTGNHRNLQSQRTLSEISLDIKHGGDCLCTYPWADRHQAAGSRLPSEGEIVAPSLAPADLAEPCATRVGSAISLQGVANLARGQCERDLIARGAASEACVRGARCVVGRIGAARHRVCARTDAEPAPARGDTSRRRVNTCVCGVKVVARCGIRCSRGTDDRATDSAGIARLLNIRIVGIGILSNPVPARSNLSETPLHIRLWEVIVLYSRPEEATAAEVNPAGGCAHAGIVRVVSCNVPCVAAYGLSDHSAGSADGISGSAAGRHGECARCTDGAGRADIRGRGDRRVCLVVSTSALVVPGRSGACIDTG